MLPRDLPDDPGLDVFEALARRAFADLPDGVRAACGRVVFRVADLADRATLAALEIDDPLDLTGLYVGSALQPELAGHGPVAVPEVWLYRAAILEEWHERGNVGLDELIAHVLIHEIAHHFGWDDDGIDRVQGDG